MLMAMEALTRKECCDQVVLDSFARCHLVLRNSLVSTVTTRLQQGQKCCSTYQTAALVQTPINGPVLGPDPPMPTIAEHSQHNGKVAHTKTFFHRPDGSN